MVKFNKFIFKLQKTKGLYNIMNSFIYPKSLKFKFLLFIYRIKKNNKSNR